MLRKIRVADIRVVVNSHQREVASVFPSRGIELTQVVIKKLHQPTLADGVAGGYDDSLH